MGDLVRSHLIYTRRFTVVFDTLLGPKSGAWLAARAAERGKPVLVVVSHSDWDHCWGNQCFPNTPLISTQLCAERMAGDFGQAELKKKREEHRDYEDVRVVPPALQPQGAFRIDGGDLTLEFLPSPGHRSDHLALWIPEVRTLLPGDGVETPFALLDDEQCASVNLRDMVSTLQSFLRLKPEWTLANHAPPQPGFDLIRSNLEHYWQLQKLVAQHSSVDALLQAFPYSGPADADFYRGDHERIVRAVWEVREKLQDLAPGVAPSSPQKM